MTKEQKAYKALQEYYEWYSNESLKYPSDIDEDDPESEIWFERLILLCSKMSDKFDIFTKTIET